MPVLRLRCSLGFLAPGRSGHLHPVAALADEMRAVLGQEGHEGQEGQEGQEDPEGGEVQSRIQRCHQYREVLVP